MSLRVQHVKSRKMLLLQQLRYIANVTMVKCILNMWNIRAKNKLLNKRTMLMFNHIFGLPTLLRFKGQTNPSHRGNSLQKLEHLVKEIKSV